jgi:excisionase family DNA binding protein
VPRADPPEAGYPGLTPAQDEFLTVAEVAELLKLNQQTVRNWIDAGALPAVRVGARRVRITRADLDAYLERRRGAESSEDVRAHDPSPEAWQGLAVAMTRATASLAAGERKELSRALLELAEAAQTLAGVLDPGASGKSTES